MKKILFLFILAIVFVSCEPDDIVDKGQLDPNAMITLRPGNGVQLRSSVPDLTALEIVQQAHAIRWQSNWFANTEWDDVKNIARGFPDQYKDFNKPALLMLGTDIIAQGGEYYRDFIYGFNIYITNADSDTIAYIPDAVINSARPLIEAAYNDENYTEVYRLFNEAFTFLPIQ